MQTKGDIIEFLLSRQRFLRIELEKYDENSTNPSCRAILGRLMEVENLLFLIKEGIKPTQKTEFAIQTYEKPQYEGKTNAR